MRKKKLLVSMLTSMLAVSTTVVPAFASVNQYGKLVYDTTNAEVPDGMASTYNEGSWYCPNDESAWDTDIPIVIYYNSDVASDTDTPLELLVDTEGQEAAAEANEQDWDSAMEFDSSYTRDFSKSIGVTGTLYENTSITDWGETVDFYSLNKDYWWCVAVNRADGTDIADYYLLDEDNPVWENKTGAKIDDVLIKWISKKDISTEPIDSDWKTAMSIWVSDFAKNAYHTMPDTREYKSMTDITDAQLTELTKNFFSYTYDTTTNKLTVSFKDFTKDNWDKALADFNKSGEYNTYGCEYDDNIQLNLVSKDGETTYVMYPFEASMGSASVVWDSASYVVETKDDGTEYYHCINDEDYYEGSEKYDAMSIDFTADEVDVEISCSGHTFVLGSIQNTSNYSGIIEGDDTSDDSDFDTDVVVNTQTVIPAGSTTRVLKDDVDDVPAGTAILGEDTDNATNDTDGLRTVDTLPRTGLSAMPVVIGGILCLAGIGTGIGIYFKKRRKVNEA